MLNLFFFWRDYVKKFSLVLISCSMFLTMTGCLSDKVSKIDKPSPNVALDEIYRHNYSVSLYQFGNITKLLSQANTQKDLYYAKGFIDSYLSTVPNFIPRITSKDKATFNKLVVIELQVDIDNLFVDIGEYSSYLQELVQKNDIETIKSLRPELEKLYEIERALNDERYSKIEEATRYQERLSELHSVIHSRLNK